MSVVNKPLKGPPAAEQGGEQKQKPELPVGVGFVGGFGLDELEFGQVLKGFRLLELGFAGVSEVGGALKQESVALLDLKKAGLSGCTE
jgi:hypothetical protein